jgi:hypothetical protein
LASAAPLGAAEAKAHVSGHSGPLVARLLLEGEKSEQLFEVVLTGRANLPSAVVIESTTELSVFGVGPLILLERWVEPEEVVLAIEPVVESLRPSMSRAYASILSEVSYTVTSPPNFSSTRLLPTLHKWSRVRMNSRWVNGGGGSGALDVVVPVVSLGADSTGVDSASLLPDELPIHPLIARVRKRIDPLRHRTAPKTIGPDSNGQEPRRFARTNVAGSGARQAPRRPGGSRGWLPVKSQRPSLTP